MAATLLYKKFLQGIGLIPKASTTNAVAGDLEVLTDNRLHFFGASNDAVTTDAVSTTLTNKTIAAGSNTITGLTNTNLSGTAGITGANIANATVTGTNVAASTIANSNLAQMSALTVKSNISGSTANPTDAPVSTTATSSSFVLRDSNGISQFTNVVEGFQSITTVGGTSTLITGSPATTQFTGTTTQTLVLPNATTLTPGQAFQVFNRSTGVVTVNMNGGSLLQSMAGNTQAIFTVSGTGTAPGTWDSAYSAFLSSPLTTKGDLWGFSTTNTRQPVPVDNGLLVPDNSQTTGYRTAGYSNKQNGVTSMKTYIQYGDFENAATTGYSLGTTGTLTNGIPTGTPTFGSGTTALTLSTVSSGQLAGTNSLALTASAATTAGNMFATAALPIDIADQAKVLTYKYSYSVPTNPTNGNFSGTSSNSFGVAAWDVTNSSWLPVVGNFAMTQTTGVGIATGTFQTNATTASIRFVVYCANATSGAITLYFDDFYVGPQTAPIGFAGTDLATATTNGGAMVVSAVTTAPTKGTVTKDIVRVAKLGDHARIKWEYSQSAVGSATAGSGDYLFTLPNGLSFDPNKVTFYTGGSGTSVAFIVPAGLGTATTSSTGASSNSIGVAVPYDATHFRLATNYALVPAGSGGSASGGFIGSTYYPFNDTGTSTYTVDFDAPIAGWSSNVQMSSDTDTRVVAATWNGVTASGTITNSLNPIILPSPTKITDGAYNSSTGVYTVGVTGWYVVAPNLEISIGGAQSNTAVQLNKNGSIVTGIFNGVANAAFQYLNGLATVFCNAGDTLQLLIQTNSGTVTYTTSASSLAIFRLSGPAVIAATESVTMKYLNTAGTSIPNTGDNNVPFATKAFDSHNAYNTSTGIYTVPVSGKYSLKGTINYSSQTYGVNNQLIASVYKNGAIDTYGDIAPVMAIVTLPFGSVVDTTVQCNAGDTLEFRAQNTRSAGATTLNTGTGFNHIEIERVGN